MPSATAGFPDLTPYFKLDGSRTITGPSLLALSAGNAAFDALTIRGAASQTGKLLVLETSALADVFSVDNAGKAIFTVDLPSVVGGNTAALSGVVTLATGASGTPSDYGDTYGRGLTATQGSGATLKNWRGDYGLTTLAGRWTNAYQEYKEISSSSAQAATDFSAGYFKATHSGAGLLSFIEGLQIYTTATGPTTQVYGFYNFADNAGATANVYGSYTVGQSRSGAAVSASVIGQYVRANLLSGSTTPLLIGMDVSTSGAGTSTIGIRVNTGIQQTLTTSSNIFNSPISLGNGANIIPGTGAGTQYATATTQKQGWWGATPIVRPVLATGAGATVDNVITVLQTLGLVGQT